MEVLSFNLTNSGEFLSLFAAFLMILAFGSLLYIKGEKRAEVSERKIIIFQYVIPIIAVILLLAEMLITILTVSWPSPSNPKYYSETNVPLSEYSLSDKLYKTKDGKVLDGNKRYIAEETNTSLSVKKTKVMLKEYRLKKKWYGMKDADREYYKVFITKPAKNVKKNL